MSRSGTATWSRLRDMTFDVRAGRAVRVRRQQRRRQDHHDARRARGARAPTRARCAGTAARSTLETRRQIGYMPEERGLYPRMKVRDQLVYLARLHGMSKADATASTDRWLDRLGVDRPPRRRGAEAEPGQPAAGAARRVAGARPADPRARRAVLRARPGRRRRDEPGDAREGRRRHPGGVLQPPARPGGAAVRPGRHRPQWTDGGRRRGRRAAGGRPAPARRRGAAGRAGLGRRAAGVRVVAHRQRHARRWSSPTAPTTRPCCAPRSPPARCAGSATAGRR